MVFNFGWFIIWLRTYRLHYQLFVAIIALGFRETMPSLYSLILFSGLHNNCQCQYGRWNRNVDIS